MDTKYVLLTGGAGYIGSHTAYALKMAGYTPIVLDDLSGGHAQFVKFGPFVHGDMGHKETVAAICAEYKPVALLHFAAFIDVAQSMGEPKLYLHNNYEKAAILFETVLQHNVRHIVFSSTAALYGQPEQSEPLTEDQPTYPINPYGVSKLLAEKYLASLSARGPRSVVLRYFNAAGAAAPEIGIGEAHKNETHLIPNIILAGLEKKRGLKFYGADYPTPDGTPIRDYVHVLDLAAAHVAALRYLQNGGQSEICNLGTGSGYSVKQILQMAEKLLGKPINYETAPRRGGDAPFLVANAAKAHALLGWQPQYTLEQCVGSALAWHQSALYTALCPI